MEGDTQGLLKSREQNSFLSSSLASSEENEKKQPPRDDLSNGGRHHHHRESAHAHGATRKVKRRYRRNQDGVNFLRRFTLAIVVIDLMLAISESSLLSTFFLFLTISTTFDVKPENVIETYCYYAPVGNSMCEDYMDRLTGFSSSSPLNHRNGGGVGSSFASTSSSSVVLNMSRETPSPHHTTTENHFPTVPTRPRLTEQESYQLFLIYNLSFYDPPARFNLEWGVDNNSKLSKLYNQLVLELAENKVILQNRSVNTNTNTVFHIPFSRDYSPSAASSQIFNSFRQAVEVVGPSAPNLRAEIPQVSTAMRRMSALQKIRRIEETEGGGAQFLPVAPSKFWEANYDKYVILNENQTPLFKNMHKNLLQIRQFIRHRWKRQTGRTTSASFGNGENKSAVERPQTASSTTLSSSSGAEMATEKGKHEPTHPPSVSNGKDFSSESTSKSNNVVHGGGGGDGADNQVNTKAGIMSGGEENRKGEGERLPARIINGGGDGGGEHSSAGYNQSHHHHAHANDTERTPFPEIQSSPSSSSAAAAAAGAASTTTTKQNQKASAARKVKESDKVLMRELYKVMSQRGKFSSSGGDAEFSSNTKTDLELMISIAEGNLNTLTQLESTTKSKANGHKANSPHISPGQSSAKRKNREWKSFQELFTKLEKSPRALVGLMESSLFNNWKQFLETARRRSMYANNGGGGGDCAKWDDPSPQCAGMTIPVTKADGEKRPDQQQDKGEKKDDNNLILSMDMDLFSPETYQKAERRRKAIQQIYHDYSSSILGELAELKEMPVSPSFNSVYLTVKVYTLTWQVVICLVLFFGSVYEDKTALNIWGIFNILTSLLHFLVDEWINMSFQPEKTTAAIWFGVVYGVYKPITILLVATLSSEILKGSSGKKEKGLWANLSEIIKGRKRPPLSKAMQYLERLGEVVVVQDGEKVGSGNNNDDNSGNNNNLGEGGGGGGKRRKLKVNLVGFRNGKVILRPCPSEKFRGDVLSKSKSPCYLFYSLEDGTGSQFRTLGLNAGDIEKLSDKQLAHLSEELKMLPVCVYPSKELTYDPFAGILSDSEEDDDSEDEDQLEVVEDEDEDDDTDSDIGDDMIVAEEEVATTIENSRYLYHKELEGKLKSCSSQERNQLGLSELSSKGGGGGIDVAPIMLVKLAERLTSASVSSVVTTISGVASDTGNALNSMSGCSGHLNRAEQQATSPLIVDGGNVHI